MTFNNNYTCAFRDGSLMKDEGAAVTLVGRKPYGEML